MKNFLRNIFKDEQGQDLIEYALMAGFVAVAAGAIMPNVATSIWCALFGIGDMKYTPSQTSSNRSAPDSLRCNFNCSSRRGSATIPLGPTIGCALPSSTNG